MAREVNVPSVGESVQEVIIATWLKSDGEYVEMDDPICEVESDKANFEIGAEAAGVLKILVEEGETVAVGDKVAEIDTEADRPEGEGEKKEAKKSKEGAESAQEEEKEAPSQSEEVEEREEAGEEIEESDKIASPAARKILREGGLSPSRVEGTGKDGRITKEDARRALEEKKKSAPKTEKKEDREERKEVASLKPGSRETRKEKMSTLRKTIARRLVEAKNTTAMLTTFNDVDMTAIMNLRREYKEKFEEKHDVRLGFMSFFAKAVCEAIRDFPALNGQVQDDHVIYHDYVDLGIAVSTPKGLVVPVIRNAESKSLAHIEHAVHELAGKARKGKLSIDEMEGGTFTITNGGVFGSLLSTPILNPPQSAILGMHRIEERPVAIDGEVEVRPMMYVAVSYDHRIVDGKESVSFLVRIKELLEDPTRLLLEV